MRAGQRLVDAHRRADAVELLAPDQKWLKNAALIGSNMRDTLLPVLHASVSWPFVFPPVQTL